MRGLIEQLIHEQGVGRLLHLRLKPHAAAAAGAWPRARRRRRDSRWNSRWPAVSACATAGVRPFIKDGNQVQLRVCREGPVFDLQEATAW